MASSLYNKRTPTQHKALMFWRQLQRNRLLYHFNLIVILVCVVYTSQRLLSNFASRITWVAHPIAHIERTCPVPGYATLSGYGDGNNNNKDQQQQRQASDAARRSSSSNPHPTTIDPRRICITTLTDEKQKSFATRYLGWRNFDGVLPLTWQNKLDYVNKHGYRLFDESARVDKSRPPAWSKVTAAQRLLTEEDCSWVLWLDADTIIMDSNRRLEDFLPLASDSHDMLITIDEGGGYNSGAWIVRDSPWSLQLLTDWWNMKSFVRTPGMSKCGDNHALKHLLANTPEFDSHVLVPPRCTFNSFVSVVTPGAYKSTEAKIDSSRLYMHEGYYHKGDFLVHLAGYDNKIGIAKLFLELAV